MRYGDRHEKIKSDIRLLVLTVILICVFVLLISRLYNLQMLSKNDYSAQSERNRTRLLTISAVRGNIYDADMNELATSEPVFTVSLLAVPAKDREAVAEALAKYLEDDEITASDIYDTLMANARQYESVLIKRLPYNEESIRRVAILEEHKAEIPGLLIGTESMRVYPYDALFGHSLGYVGLITQTELDSNLTGDYQSSDWVGKSGLEKSYETFYIGEEQVGLRGQSGVQQVIINSKNYPVASEVLAEPKQGNSLVITMDMEVQKVMEQSLEAVIKELQKEYPECHSGAAVLLDVNTSAVIASASYPFVDPNDFANGLSKANYSYYMTNEDRPLLNRAISGLYAPGSTFKPVTALAELYMNVASPNETVNCTEEAWVKPRAKCTREHGEVDLYKALAVSCNTYFQEMGSRAGIEAIYKIGSELGLGQYTGIDLPGEGKGVLPSPAYKNSIFDKNEWDYNWQEYDTFYTSMGQGYSIYTVMQLANAVATIANGGNHMQPYIVDRLIDTVTGETVYKNEPTLLNTLSVHEEELRLVREGMFGVTQQGGTSYSLFKNFPITVAAKTGTAQTSVEDSDNGVFIAYAPYDDPQIAFACVIEYGQTGSGSGGIVCYNVFSEYFGLNAAEEDETELLLPGEISISADDH